MQCIWSTAAKATPRKCMGWQTNLLARDKTRSLRTVLPKTGVLRNIRRAAFTTAAAQRDVPPCDNHSAQTDELSSESSSVPLREEGSPLPPMTTAQLSRAAASAVRQCTPADALYIVNSLHYSTYGCLKEDALSVLDEARRSTRLPLQKYVAFKPIDFGRPVSPRLSAHCFLHMLLRRGHSYQASKFAELMIENGLRIRTFTMESVLKAVCETNNSGLLARRHAWAHPSGPPPTMKFADQFFSNAGHEAAFRMLKLAREYGQQRTDAMYDTLISACLLQGEIIVAALLFACLVKDWQVRAAARAEANLNREDRSEDETRSGNLGSAEIQQRLRWMKRVLPAESILYTPFPHTLLLKKITHTVEVIFDRNPPPDKTGGELQEAFQALAILTELVDHGYMHTGKIAPLLRALYNSPKSEVPVRKFYSKDLVSVPGYDYFHDFLLRLIRSLRNPSTMTAPPLDIRSCNTLLHYSLRHRLSPKLATHVMEYMVNKRGFHPDIVAFNVLLRSGTTLRRDDLAVFALKSIQQLRGFEDPDTTIRLKPNVHAWSLQRLRRRQSLQGEGKDPRSRLTTELTKLCKERFRAPPNALKPPSSLPPLEADEATIVSYITHITATGKPYLIARVLFDILPELVTVSHPAWGNVPVEDRRAFRLDRKEAMQQAVRLGPRFFTAVLNALAKAGKTGLAERVWILAKKAEKSSWVEGFVPGADPWYLPVSAYTCMLQCYGSHIRKGVPRRIIDKAGNASWEPRARDQVVGWAQLLHHGREVSGQGRNRSEAAKAMASLVVNSMMSGGSLVVRQLLHLDQLLPNRHATGFATRPVPDARFWNAALRLFLPTPWMLPRRRRNTFSRTKRFLSWAQEKFNQSGSKSVHWDPLLQEIAEAMLNSGFPIPAGFRHLFIGRYVPATQPFRPPIPLDRSPFAFPRPRYRYRAHALPTSKTRGLPLRRAPPKPRRRPGRAQPPSY